MLSNSIQSSVINIEVQSSFWLFCKEYRGPCCQAISPDLPFIEIVCNSLLKDQEFFTGYTIEQAPRDILLPALLVFNQVNSMVLSGAMRGKKGAFVIKKVVTEVSQVLRELYINLSILCYRVLLIQFNKSFINIGYSNSKDLDIVYLI